jgi:aldehyde dehydrogenase (NAD+)
MSVEVISRTTGKPFAQLTMATPADVRDAYRRAGDALHAWRGLAASARATILQQAATIFRQRAAAIAEIISAEMGKPIGEATTEVEKGSAILEYFAQAPFRVTGSTYVTDTGEDVFTVAEPLGVVLLITPWNFPFTLPIRKIAAALGTGNAVLFKPARNAALCGLEIGRALADAGLPKDVLNVIVGESSTISDALFGDPLLAGVSLTGSYPTAEVIRRVLPVEIPFQAELGGKNALLIWRDADPAFAVDVIWQSSFRNNGQICTSSGRVLVHEAVADSVLSALRERLAAARPVLASGEYGILSSESEHHKIREALDLARTDGEVLDSDWGEGRMSPTVIIRPTAEPLIREEIFGPVITFETVTDVEDAITKANATSYGLTAGVVTNDLEVAKKFWTCVNAGLVKVNAPLTGTPFHIPLQGWRHSGVGPGEGGDASIGFFTKHKAVYLRRP